MNRVTLVAYRALSDLTGKGSMFLITVVAARVLSQRAFGIFSLAATLGWLLAVATDFGIQMHVAREVAKTPSCAADIVQTWLRIRIATAFAAIGLVALGLSVARPDRAYVAPILLFSVVYVVSGLVEFLNYFYRGLGRSDLESSLTLAQRLTTLVCAVAALAWRPSLSLLAAAMLVPVAATFGYSLVLARRLADGSIAARSDARDVQERRASSKVAKWSDIRHDVLPIGAGIVLSALYFRIDVFLIELWRGTEAVAVYNAVFRLVEALRLFPAAVLAVALPSLCRAMDLRPLAHVAAVVTIFGVAVSLLLWATAEWTIPFVYGERYAEGVTAFRILLLAFPLMSLNYALTHQLIGWEGQRAYAVVCGTALVVNVALNARLVPALSIQGAAWATCWTEAVVTAGCAIALAPSRSVLKTA